MVRSTLLQRTCLKPTSSLRTQMLRCFGTSAFVSLVVVVLLACLSTFFAGRTVKSSADELMRRQVTDNLLIASRLVGEQFDAYMRDVEGTVQLIVEAVQDRIVGYPYDGWQDDRYVPFVDSSSGRRVYPLEQPPPPMEWNITPNMNLSSVSFHYPGQWLDSFPSITTATGAYFMQGSCDPAETDPSAQTYYPNCTDANNNFTTGGTVQPTPTNKYLHDKAGDLSVFLKALWESQSDALTIGVYFHNSGAGSQVVFPGYYWPGEGHPMYTSLGCDWMRRINPRTGRPLASEADMSRCHPAGTRVPQREYNPMERPWFQQFVDQSLEDGDRVSWYGPYKSFDHGSVILTVGKAVYDRRSGELIGCVGIDISIHDLSNKMQSSLLNDHSELMLVRFDDGTLITNSLHSKVLMEDGKPAHIEDMGLVDPDTFITFQSAIDFDKSWTPAEAEKAFSAIAKPCDRGMMTAYPIPVIPDEYNPDYRPKFFVVHLIAYGVFNVVNDIHQSIDSDVRHICILAGGLAVFGMILVLAIVWCVSRMLTQPLLWIETLSWRIVNHNLERSGDAIALKMPDDNDEYGDNQRATMRCAPKTEVNDLVAEFRTMIKGFSGDGASRVAESTLHELRNDLTWHSDFQQLYSAPHRKKKSTSSRQTSVGSSTTSASEESSNLSAQQQRGILNRPLNEKANMVVNDVTSSLIVPAPVKRNWSNVIRTPSHLSPKEKAAMPIRLHRSPLFWWIVIFIVIPLLLVIAVICAIVSNDIVSTIPAWVQQADEASNELALQTLNLTAASKASLISALVFEAVRDLHVITRVAGWLYFGGIKQSSAFTEMESASEECKIYQKGKCPFYSNVSRHSCPCEWDDPTAKNCSSTFNATQSRNLQKHFWTLQSQDADPETGERLKSKSFRESGIGRHPNTTQWWSDPAALPGAEIGDQASGFSTSYDRLRVASAMSVVAFPVYNYAHDLGRKNRHLGIYVALKHDGLFTGFSGCRYTHADSAFWKSTQDNLAAVVAPELCPIGKYGYDPRCRDWYTTGRDSYAANRTAVHITAPYQFAIEDNIVATSATSPIANPNTDEYIGQTLVDFHPEGIKSGLERHGSLMSILITPNADVHGGDTVLGPNKSAGWESASILDLLFEYDEPGSPYRSKFENNCLRKMKSGATGLTEFNRSTEDGNVEALVIAFAPVLEVVHLATSPDDFSKGVETFQELLYSVGMVRNVDDIHAPFDAIEGDIQMQLDGIRTIYVIVTVVVAVLFAAFACIVTLSIVSPMITLLRAVQNINNRVVDNDLPPLKGGSREVQAVYNTFAKLYKVVRVSNTAFFSGNLKWAYHFVDDALKLFRKVNDEKAVGIACNNLGNTLFAIYYDAVDIGLDAAGNESIIPIALRHYAESIEIAQRDFDCTPESELKAEFALQLADRLFNRGMFLLLVLGDDQAPEDARQMALDDIQRAKNLDDDVKDYMMDHKLLLKYSSSFFSRLLRRLNGLADFYDDAELQAIYDVKDVTDDADQLLFAAWNEPSAPLFDEVNRVGRLQQLEGSAIVLWLAMGKQVEAARLAMRMFSEDEYILETSFVRAADALQQIFYDSDGLEFSKRTISCTRDDLRRMVKNCKNVSYDVGKCLVFAVELCERWEGDLMLEKINTNSLALYDRYCTANDYVGIAAYGVEESLTVELLRKEENEGRQRGLLDIATSSTAERANPAFPLAIQMVVDSQAALENDTYILLMVDGYAWDDMACLSLKLQIDKLNKERKTMIHLFIIGLDMEDENAREQCKELCSVSKKSMYVDATLETLDSIFETITTTIAGRPVNNGFLKGITMERF